jgi:pimeloyl-ACP methyl ester carboxylesterase
MRIAVRTLPLLLAALLAGCAAPGEGVPGPSVEPGTEAVVLVHGLGRSPLSMLPLAWTLERDGYRVVNFGYLSPLGGVDEHGHELAEVVAGLRDDPEIDRIHFVGHSLGNLLIRHVIGSDPPAKLGRVVMLAPPNQGAQAADRWEPWLGWLAEPLADLTTDPEGTARTLPAAGRAEVGVIAGAFDDRVRVEETVLRGQADHRVVPAGHTFLMWRMDVQRLTLAFLRTGTFEGVPGDQATAEPTVEYPPSRISSGAGTSMVPLRSQ